MAARKKIGFFQQRSLFVECLERRDMLSISPLLGDYTGNNSVGPEDYDLWVANYGSTTNLAADGNGDGKVDAADYTAWRDNEGATRTPAPFLNVVVDTLGEAEETSPGAIVFRNNDFSKETLYATQPEAGLPLYIPDYLAPSDVYDGICQWPPPTAVMPAQTVDVQSRIFVSS